jgi:putative transposase
VVREWLLSAGARTLHIEPGSPLETGYYESYNGKLLDDLLHRDILYSLKEAQVNIQTSYNYIQSV